MSLVAAQCESLRGSPVWLYFPASGDVAQLGERGVRNAEVEGSIPFVSTSHTKAYQGGRPAKLPPPLLDALIIAISSSGDARC